MSSRRMKVSKCPSDTLTMTNRAIVNTRDFDKQVTTIEIKTDKLENKSVATFLWIEHKLRKSDWLKKEPKIYYLMH